MKTALCTIPIRIRSIQSALAMALVVFVQPTRGQGTITFDHATGFAGTTYSESGMQFRVIMPSPGRYDEIGVSGPISGPSNIPYNVTVRRCRLTLRGEGVAGWQGETTIITIPHATTPPHRQRES